VFFGLLSRRAAGATDGGVEELCRCGSSSADGPARGRGDVPNVCGMARQEQKQAAGELKLAREIHCAGRRSHPEGLGAVAGALLVSVEFAIFAVASRDFMQLTTEVLCTWARWRWLKGCSTALGGREQH
jgi:hypothetical protein